LEHIPDDWNLQNIKRIERNYMFGILVSLAPEYVEQLVLDIRAQRLNQQVNKARRQQPIGVEQQWVNQLLA